MYERVSQDFPTAEHHTFMDYYNRPGINANLPGIVVPQAAYVSPTPIRPHPPLRFVSYNNVPGVQLRSALNAQFSGLSNGAQVITFPENEPKNGMSIHIQVSTPIPRGRDVTDPVRWLQWPGYPAMQRKINFPDQMRGAVTYRALSAIVARIVEQYMTVCS